MPTMKWIADHVDVIHVWPHEKVCANCAHFHQHYIRGMTEIGARYFPISVGHCAKPRRKDRRAGDTCPHFEPKIKE